MKTTFAVPLDTRRIDRAMRRYAAGDSSAFPELFGLLAPRLHRQLRALCGSDELARELAQETFLRIHRARASFRQDLSVLPWVYAIARNCYASHIRAWNVRLLRSCLEADDDLLRADVKDETEARAIARETGRALDRAIARLPACQRQVVYLRGQGYSLGEIADDLGVSAGAVKLRSFRGSRVLRRALSRPGNIGRDRAQRAVAAGFPANPAENPAGASPAQPKTEPFPPVSARASGLRPLARSVLCESARNPAAYSPCP